MLSHRERTQQLMADPMFEVANHTWEHRNLRLMSGQALVDEIRNAQLAYEQVRAELQAKQCMGPQGNALAHERAPRRLGLMRSLTGLAARRR
jgi:Predicted xylanase/chitin deacetylase